MEPTDIVPYIAIIWITVTDPSGNHVMINTREIVSMRDVSGAQALAEGSKCMISTLDSKYIAVLEDCRVVIMDIIEAHKNARNQSPAE